MVRFSEHFSITPNQQGDLEFVDVRLDTDNQLFLDPTVMAVSRNERFRNWYSIVQSFIATTLTYYENGDLPLAQAIFNSSNESNEIFLGYSTSSPRGNGNTETSLTEVFNYVVREGILGGGIVERVEDLSIFVPKFGPDYLSDLVASLLKRELILFTVEQCAKHEINRTVELERPFWNHNSRSWETITEMLPATPDGRPIVLVPKDIVVAEYAYSPLKYLSDIVAIRRQEYHRDNDTDLHKRREIENGFVNKKLIYQEEIKEEGLTRKQYLIIRTREEVDQIRRFRDRIRNTQQGTNGGRMTDEELQEFIANSYVTQE